MTNIVFFCCLNLFYMISFYWVLIQKGKGKTMRKKIRKSISNMGFAMKKVMICVLAISLMASSCMQAQAIIGTSNILRNNNVSFDGGSGHTEDTACEINTVDQFLKFANDVSTGNTYEGYYFKLASDIDLKDVENFKPIGSGNVDGSSNSAKIKFQGYFDGYGHSILNLKIGKENKDYQGLFAAIGENGTISRLIVDASVKGNSYVGIIAGQNEGTIKNCGTTKTSVIYGKLFMGGITGDNTGKVLNCYNMAEISSYNDWNGLAAHTGGLVGGGNSVYNCYNVGDVIFTAGNNTSWGEISPSSSGCVNCFYDISDEANNGSGAGTALSQSEMKSNLANILNSKIAIIDEEKICLWTQEQGEYPKLSNDFYKKPTSLTISSNVLSIKLGETVNLTANVLPIDANNKAVTWQVINGTGIATINSAGLLTPVKEGTVTIRAIANENSLAKDDISITILKVLTAPTFSYIEGRYSEKINLKLSSDEGADIYYTIDYFNVKPTVSDIKYTGPIEIDVNARVYAYAKKENCINSSKLVKTYIMQIPKVKAVLIEGYPNGVYRGSKHILNQEMSYSLDYEYLTSSQVGIISSIESKHDKYTYIKDGCLFIAEDENAEALTVRLTSEFDNSKYSEVNIKILNDNIVSFENFSDIKDIENGTDIDDIVLPKTVKISKSHAPYTMYASIKWDRENVEYDSSSELGQSFEVNGTVQLPLGVENSKNIDTSVKIKVSVLAKDFQATDDKGGVSGLILDSNKSPFSGVRIRLTKGGHDKNTLYETSTDNDGNYSFVNVANGVYSLIAEKDVQIITKTIIINGKNITQNINMPSSNLDTKLEIKSEGTPNIAADNLENVVDITADNIEVKLVVDKKDEKIAVGSSEIKAYLDKNEHVDIFLDASLFKIVNGGAAESIQPKVGSKVKITIDVPADISGKKSYSIIRYHQGVIERLICDYNAQLNTLTFETDKFSTYAISYKDKTEIVVKEPIVEVNEKEKIVLPFVDVSSTDTYNEALQYMYEHAYISGTSETKFSPDLSTSRAMIVTILWRMDGKPNADYDLKNFQDIDSKAYYIDAINWAIENNIIRGYSDTVLAPDDNITREQFAAILQRFSDYQRKSSNARIDDSLYNDFDSVADYAQDAMNWILAEDILICKSLEINPKCESKRCDIVCMLYNYVK